MRTFVRMGLLVSTLLIASQAYAQCTLPPAPDETKQRVIDARPNQVFAAKGKTRFGKKGTIVIKNMNPFLFEGYRINIQEEEIKDEAVVKFAKALIPIAGQFTESSKQEAAFDKESRVEDFNLAELVKRLSNNPTKADGTVLPAVCAATDKSCLAMTYMIDLKKTLVTAEQAVSDYFVVRAGGGSSYLTTTNFLATKTSFTNAGSLIFDRDTETAPLCAQINTLHGVLNSANAYPSKDVVTEQQRKIEDMVSKAKALKKAVDLYKQQDALKDTKWIGSTGFDYIADLDLLADELIGPINTKYDAKARALFDQVVDFDDMKESIKNLNGKESTLLQQEFPIGGKYDYSKVTVTVQPFGEKTAKDSQAKKETTRDGDAPAGNNGPVSNQNGTPSSPPNEGTGIARGESARTDVQRVAEAGGDGGGQPSANPTPNPAATTFSKTTDIVMTGKPRFEIGIGMAYSPVEKRQFQIVSGFARDRDGNLTNGETFTKIVGFSERTKHRITPVALLHTRLTEFPRHNLYFSLGITGSRDALGTNIEYLIGPSVNLSDDIFVTVGAFGARQQRLAGDDVFANAAVPAGFDVIPVRSHYSWKPGLSFSYRLPVTGSSKKKAASEGAASGLDTTTDVVFAGQPRFTISAGMAYSSLRQQSFQPIIGFARDRDGDLTNGQTLTKIVGFSEDASGRLLPMALLNTRILSNQDVGLHFSLGITAKRTNADTNVEYLIGPSVSFMKNQIIFTAGAYAGKQEKIAGDLFINSVLASGTSISTEREYRFKPGFAFSYRLPVKLP